MFGSSRNEEPNIGNIEYGQSGKPIFPIKLDIPL